MFRRANKRPEGPAGLTKDDARSALDDVKARVAELERKARQEALGKRVDVQIRVH